MTSREEKGAWAVNLFNAILLQNYMYPSTYLTIRVVKFLDDVFNNYCIFFMICKYSFRSNCFRHFVFYLKNSKFRIRVSEERDRWWLTTEKSNTCRVSLTLTKEVRVGVVKVIYHKWNWKLTWNHDQNWRINHSTCSSSPCLFWELSLDCERLMVEPTD